MNAKFERSAKAEPTTDYSYWEVVRVSQDDASRMEYGFYPDSDAGVVPAFVSRTVRKPNGSWKSVAFWDARYSDDPCPDIPEPVWHKARAKLMAWQPDRSSLQLRMSASTIGAVGIGYSLWAYLS